MPGKRLKVARQASEVHGGHLNNKTMFPLLCGEATRTHQWNLLMAAAWVEQPGNGQLPDGHLKSAWREPELGKHSSNAGGNGFARGNATGNA